MSVLAISESNSSSSRIVAWRPNCPLSSSRMKDLNACKKIFFATESVFELMAIIYSAVLLSECEDTNRDLFPPISLLAGSFSIINSLISWRAFWEWQGPKDPVQSPEEDELDRQSALKWQKFCNPLELSNELIILTSMVALSILLYKCDPSSFSTRVGVLGFAITCNILKIVDISHRIWCAGCCVGRQGVDYETAP